MLDVVFILLIFFIVTSKFVTLPGIEPDKPDAETAEAWEPGILVAVNSLNEVWIDKQPYDVSEVRPILLAMREENPKAQAILQGDKEAEAGVMAQLQSLMQELEIQTRVATEK
jgi:biopolymer transport protein ExbD